MALNVSIYHLKKLKKKLQTVSLNDVSFQIFFSIEDSLDDKLKIIHLHIQKLNVVERGLIMLYLDGKNYAEMAEVMGISESNVGTKIGRIKSKLKSNIRKEKEI